MRPLMYSVINAKKFGKGWVRSGVDVCYYQNSMKKKTAGHYYTLSFSVTMENSNDTVYFAHSHPYTFSDLQRYLSRLEADPKKNKRFKRKELCKTLAGNTCDMLIITSFGCDYEELRRRKGVVISSRVHPGETGASYMMKGIIDYLVGPSLGARLLRDNFLFKIIPMVNPDGVINGNTRCSLAGCDLNRVWIEPSPKLHPTVWNIKYKVL
jgi:cytosolic carboxypeptidase protein 2/3